jgi:hypothetical protein
LIDFAKSQNKPIILTTDDQKDDWWRIEKGKTLGPRPELIEEIRSKAGVAFYMYNASQFLIYAKEFLGFSVEQKAIDEVADVSQRDSAVLYLGHVVEEAVQDWLESRYPQSQIIREYRESPELPRLDFLLIDSDGIRIAVQVRYFSHLHYVNNVVKQMLSIVGRGQKVDKTIIFIVTSDVPNVIRILEILENKMSFQKMFQLSLVILGQAINFFMSLLFPMNPNRPFLGRTPLEKNPTWK